MEAMTDESKLAAKSLAENLNLKLRGVVQRALPEIYEGDDEIKAEIAEFDIEQAPGAYRQVTATERLNRALDYFYLDQDLAFYEDQKRALKKKYIELNNALDQKIARCKAGKERLREPVLYRMVSIPVSEVEQRASIPTNLLTPSQELKERESQNNQSQ